MANGNIKNGNTLYGVYHGCHGVDRMTDTVFFSDWLPKECPILYESLHKILHEKCIDHRLLTNTRDIWCRDYMPIQTDWNHFVFYKYNPDYLQKPHLRRTITDVNKVGNIDCLHEGEIANLDLVIDGGNIVKCDDKIIMTEKVFFENKDKSQVKVIRMLEEAFQCGIVFLPWDKQEMLGHSDGIVHYVGNNRVLMTNYADFDASMARKYIKALDEYVEVIPLEYNVKRKHKRSWAYINFLQIGSLVLVPQLGIPEDEQALEQISAAMPKCSVVGIPALEAVRKGGALNCISWNVSTNWWCNGFMGEEYMIQDRPISWIKEAAEKGDAKCQCDLGNSYFYGQGVEKDIVEGNKWFIKAVEQGHRHAHFNLGLSYFRGEGSPLDYSKAMQLFEKSAAKGDATAQVFIAYCLEELHAPTEEIVAAYRKAAKMGDTDAQCFLADSYCDGKNGMTEDRQEAYKWYYSAATLGNEEAQFQVGLMYEYGEGVRKNMKEAAKWFRVSASKNHLSGLFSSGCCYYYGDGTKVNKKWAFQCFQKAAAAGHVGAKCMIGYHYFNGYAVEENEEEAVRWFKMAASGNYVPAIFMLGYCLYNGKGVTEDKSAALGYFQQAAKDDYAKAIFMIGEYYHNGIVVEKDDNEAIKYYERASKLGESMADNAIYEIYNEREKMRSLFDNVPF
ncbi:MAG: SEL1-like repeat protein [Bacteroidales bacterium]|nr:SEL1-like repeat protein [Bacteroidales bacterium]